LHSNVAKGLNSLPQVAEKATARLLVAKVDVELGCNTGNDIQRRITEEIPLALAKIALGGGLWVVI
jgi:hypothetical protein